MRHYLLAFSNQFLPMPEGECRSACLQQLHHPSFLIEIRKCSMAGYLRVFLYSKGHLPFPKGRLSSSALSTYDLSMIAM